MKWNPYLTMLARSLCLSVFVSLSLSLSLCQMVIGFLLKGDTSTLYIKILSTRYREEKKKRGRERVERGGERREGLEGEEEGKNAVRI